MSHTVKNRSTLKYNDFEIMKRVGTKLGVEVKKVTDFKLYDGTRASGIALYFKGWRYPAIVTENDEILTDTYNGNWGNESLLEKFTQHTAVQKQTEYLDRCCVPYEVEEHGEEIRICVTC